ncbi:hypothetical protein TNCV_4823011 [Trichonephila clavipes]|nr:hypothetical protein TNCV_4823011 [Trichonephila clavipes]
MMLGLTKVVFSILLSGMLVIGRAMESGRRGLCSSSGESYVEEEVKIILDRVISDRKERERSKQEERERDERMAREARQHELELRKLELSQQNQPLNDESGRRVEIGPLRFN